MVRISFNYSVSTSILISETAHDAEISPTSARRFIYGLSIFSANGQACKVVFLALAVAAISVYPISITQQMLEVAVKIPTGFLSTAISLNSFRCYKNSLAVTSKRVFIMAAVSDFFTYLNRWFKQNLIVEKTLILSHSFSH